jgi:endoglucanase
MCGFESDQGWRLNPSYLPPQVVARFALIAPIWAELADNNQRLLLQGTPKGIAPRLVAVASRTGLDSGP